MADLIRETVRNLRRKQTEAEAMIWLAVRNRKLDGKKFLRQHPIRFEIDGKSRFFVADFYCHEMKLVIEIDGTVHERQKDYDELRTYIINTLGMKVIRFRNADVLNDINKVLARLREQL